MLNFLSQMIGENATMGRTEKLFEQPSALSNDLDWRSSVPVEDSNIRLIPLSRGMSAIVDAADFDQLSQWKWYAQKCGSKYYAARHERGTARVLLMHRELLAPPELMEIDHEDGDGLNNCRSNIRLATHRENNLNKGPTRRSTSGIKGVSFDKATGKWRATIRTLGHSIYLGIFISKDDAGNAYRNAANRLHGQFAHKGIDPKANGASA